MDEVLDVANLTKSYDTGSEFVAALNGVSVRVNRGEFVAIMGASGSGKSTFLHLVAGLDRPSSGAVRIEGKDLAVMGDRERTLFRRRRLGIIFQAYNLIPTLSALENVALPAMLDGRNGSLVAEKAERLLQLVDLTHRKTHRPQAMSGGEQQRAAIARAFVNDPALVLADEPTGNLDTKHGEAIWKLLKDLSRQEGKTVLAVTHEPAAAAHADRVIVLKDGRIVGELSPGGEGHAANLATRYAELVD